jgi:hypothetical protein
MSEREGEREGGRERERGREGERGREREKGDVGRKFLWFRGAVEWNTYTGLLVNPNVRAVRFMKLE